MVLKKYKNPKKIGYADKKHYKIYPNLTIGQYLKRIVKINDNTSIRLFDNKDCINRFFEIKKNLTEDGIDKIIKKFKKAGCIFNGYLTKTH